MKCLLKNFVLSWSVMAVLVSKVGEGGAKRAYALFFQFQSFHLFFYLPLFSYFSQSYEIKIGSFVIVPGVSTGKTSSSFEGYPLQVRHKQDYGRGFILLLPQTAALPESDLENPLRSHFDFWHADSLYVRNKNIEKIFFV